MKILVTGVTGFLGRSLIPKLPYKIVGISRNASDELPFPVHKLDIGPNVDFRTSLGGADVVIHCAARVHVMNDSSSDPLNSFREVNTLGTLNLAKQAADARIKRFIFISSIKVNGESTKKGAQFSSADEHQPEDPYGISKSEAEMGLLKIAKDTGMEVIIIRPPLVYGPGVKGNFFSLLKLAKMPLPLPFGAIRNKRSMVYVENLVDLIVTCIDHPKAANKVFLASDGDDLSLTRLLALVRKAMGRAKMLIPVSAFVFALVGRVVNRSDVVDRLIGNLQVDSNETKKALNWEPPYTVEQGIQATVDDFLRRS